MQTAVKNIYNLGMEREGVNTLICENGGNEELGQDRKCQFHFWHKVENEFDYEALRVGRKSAICIWKLKQLKTK